MFERKTDAVIELSSSSFEGNRIKSNVTNGLPITVMFYAPWCGYCKMAKPQFSIFSNLVRHQTKMGSLNCDISENKEISQRFNVKGYPTIIRFDKNGIPVNTYQGKPIWDNSAKEEFLKFMCGSCNGVKPKWK